MSRQPFGSLLALIALALPLASAAPAAGDDPRFLVFAPADGDKSRLTALALDSEREIGDAVVVRLDPAERRELQSMVDEGRGSKGVRKRARVLLKADQSEEGPGWTDERTAEFAEVSLSTVHRVRQRFVEEGFEAAVFRKPASDRQYRKLDGEGEARLIAVACSEAPAGRSRWTLQLLSDQLVALGVVDSISHECVRMTLKKTNSSHT